MTEEQYIDIAIEISRNAKYPYGAIVVKNGKIIGRSDDKTLMETSMYSHAELEAIESASKNKNLYGDLKGATMYVCKTNTFNVDQSKVTESMIAENPEKYLEYTPVKEVTELDRIEALEAAMLELMGVEV